MNTAYIRANELLYTVCTLLPQLDYVDHLLLLDQTPVAPFTNMV